MPNAVAIASLAVMFATRAPTNTPGQSRQPNSSNTASAIPVGGQTAVTCLVANAIERPNFAAAKYTTATITARPSRLSPD
jgi:hypothetical protein